MCSRRIGDLSEGKVYKVANLALKREVKKVAHVKKIFRTIHSLKENKACIYTWCRSTNCV
jgi:hypothetical protein